MQDEMRKQYCLRLSERGLLAWDVHRLVRLATDLTPKEVPLSAIRELDETFWFNGEGDRPTCRSIALHAKLMSETDLRYPIILSRDGRVMDGMHRVCKAWVEGKEFVLAVQFERDPEPDYIGKDPDELSY